MKRVLVGLLFTVLFCCNVIVASAAVPASRLYINGELINNELTLSGGRNLVSIRELFESLGGTVSFDKAKNEIYVTYPCADVGDQTPLEREIDEYMGKHLRNRSFSGNVLVAINGEVVVEKSYGMANYELGVPNDADKVFGLASLTKPFVATAILLLEQQGLLSTEDSVGKYLPDFAHGDVITIGQLLNHTSGIQDLTMLPEYPSFKTLSHTTEQLVAMSSERPLLFTPGERYQYNNSGYILLAAIIERVSGLRYEQLLAEQIFIPLEMSSTTVMTNTGLVANRASRYVYDYPNERYNLAPYEDASVVHAAGSIMSTARDLLLWDRALAEGTLLSPEAQAKMYQANQAGYGYGWYVKSLFGRDRVYHSGTMPGISTFVSRFLDDDVTIITLSNTTPCPIMKINDDIAAIVFGEPYTPPKERIEVPVSAQLLERYVGTYAFGPNIAKIYIENDKLFYSTGYWVSQLVPMSETEFYFKAGATDMAFVLGDDGLVSQFVNGYGNVFNRIEE